MLQFLYIVNKFDMSPELIVAIRDRLQNGQTKEEIKAAVLAMGHTDVVFEAAYTLALHDMHGAAPVREESLPRASELVVSGWNFTKSHMDLLALLLVPGIISTVLQWAEKTYTQIGWLNAATLSLSLITTIAYLVCLLAVLYSVSLEGRTSLAAAFAWVGKNFFRFLWTCILAGLVIWGGFMFFIVPGFIVLVLICFQQYAFVLENTWGMDALLRSRELVHGRFWKVAYVLGKFGLLLIIPLFLGGMLIGVGDIAWHLSSRPYANLGGNIVIEVFSVFLNIISVHAMFELYRALQARTSAPSTASVKVRYWLLVVFGLVIGIIFIIVFSLKHTANSLYKDIPAMSDATTVQNEIQGLGLTAREYLLAHNQSYIGVCDVLRPTLTSTEGVTCNDSEKAWAISAKVGEEYWCADTENSVKKVQSELGGRTTCLDLP
jgi:hypothetical protein